MELPQTIANDNDARAMTIRLFMKCYVDRLYPILLQGNLRSLMLEVMPALCERHGLDETKVHMIAEELRNIRALTPTDPDAAHDNCVNLLRECLDGNFQDAEDFYTVDTVQGVISERLSLLADGRIEGFSAYEEKIKHHAAAMKPGDLYNTAQVLESHLVSSGLGSNEAKHLIREFDKATNAALNEFCGPARAATLG